MTDELRKLISEMDRAIGQHSDGINRIASGVEGLNKKIDAVIMSMIDTKNGITPISLMRIADHQAIVKTMIKSFGVILVAALGIAKIDDIIKFLH